MKKNRIRLTESQLHRVIKECVKNIIKESFDNDVIVKVYETSDSYYEFTAKFDGGWKELRGWYDGNVYPEELCIGHSGHGRMASEEEMEEVFESLRDIIQRKVEDDIAHNRIVVYGE